MIRMPTCMKFQHRHPSELCQGGRASAIQDCIR
jgi:hypothetical protein